MKWMYAYVGTAIIFMAYGFFSAVSGNVFVGTASTLIAMLIASLSYMRGGF